MSILLADTQLAGYPQEHFNPWHMGDAHETFPDQLSYDAQYVRGLIDHYTTPNGVFGTKGQFDQIANFVGLQRLEAFFPIPLHYLYVQRRDEIRQAVSLARAVQTDQWQWNQPKKNEPEYNFYQILCCLREIKVQAKGWEMYFQERARTPYRIIYEELIANPEAILIDALTFLGISIPENFHLPPPRLRQQADHLSEQWVERFRCDMR